jgi:hypothetical protein
MHFASSAVAAEQMLELTSISTGAVAAEEFRLSSY